MKSFRKRVWEITLFQKGFSQGLKNKIILLAFSIFIFLPFSSHASPTPTDSLESLRQQFYDSHCHLIQEQYQQASEGFLGLTGKYPVMEDYIRYYLARSLMGEEKYREAITQWEDLIKNFSNSYLVDDAKIKLGHCHFELGEFEQANKLYRNTVITDPLEDARRLFYSGLCFEWGEEYEKAGDAYYRFWSYYPNTEYAAEVDIRIQYLQKEKKITKPSEDVYIRRIRSLTRDLACSDAIQIIKEFLKEYPQSTSLPEVYSRLGSCYRSLREYPKAIETYREMVRRFKGTDEAAEAYYHLSSIYWNRNMPRNPRPNLWVIISRYPNSKWADEALFILGRIEENKKHYKKAINAYDTLYRKYPRSDKTAEGLWRIGWIYYQQGKYDSGAQYLQQAANAARSLGLKNSALYWRGRCLEKLNNKEATISSYRLVLKNNYRGYYAHLARKRLAFLKVDPGKCPLPESGNTPSLQDPFSLTLCNSEQSSKCLEKARELNTMELFPEAVNELVHLDKNGCRKRDFWVGLSRLYLLNHDYRRSIQTLYKVYHDDMPIPYWQLLYPKNFEETIINQAQLYNLDTYLVMALIRQESVFDPDALSRANARGLMQLIPPTGKKIAKELNREEFVKEMLYDPEINIPFGTRYLANLNQEFKGNVILMLAAYNAGEKAAEKWQRKNNNSDPYQFIENISYPETRQYVKQVLKNYENYLWLYEGKNNNF